MSWFAQPHPIKTEVFTRLPDAFRRPIRTAWADVNKGGAALDSFLEGPAFDRDGRLYVTDIPHGRVFRIDEDGGWELVAEYDGWPNGLKIAADGRILIADHRKGLLQLDPASGYIESLLETARGGGFKGLNDLVIARSGDLYFTDQGQTGMQDPTGRVFRLTADGRLECLLDTCPSPNGIALDVAEKHLFVALTRGCQVWRMPIGPDGVIGKANVFAHTPGGISGPDGLAVDREDGLAICNPGHGCVWMLDRWGVPHSRIESCAGRTLTNLAFRPAAPHELYITDSETGQVLRANVPVSGKPMASHSD